MSERTAQGTLTLQTVPMPADTNSGGDVFGGWVVSQMDISAGTTAMDRAQGRCATVAIEALRFHAPVLVGDLFSVYSQITRTGRTSITMHIEAWVRRPRTGARHRCLPHPDSSGSRPPGRCCRPRVLEAWYNNHL